MKPLVTNLSQLKEVLSYNTLTGQGDSSSLCFCQPFFQISFELASSLLWWRPLHIKSPIHLDNVVKSYQWYIATCCVPEKSKVIHSSLIIFLIHVFLIKEIKYKIYNQRDWSNHSGHCIPGKVISKSGHIPYLCGAQLSLFSIRDVRQTCQIGIYTRPLNFIPCLQIILYDNGLYICMISGRASQTILFLLCFVKNKIKTSTLTVINMYSFHYCKLKSDKGFKFSGNNIKMKKAYVSTFVTNISFLINKKFSLIKLKLMFN